MAFNFRAIAALSGVGEGFGEATLGEAAMASGNESDFRQPEINAPKQARAATELTEKRDESETSEGQI